MGVQTANETERVNGWTRDARVWRTRLCECGTEIGWWVYLGDKRRQLDLKTCAECAAKAWLRSSGV